MRMLNRLLVAGLISGLVNSSAAALPITCVGDCDGDGTVAINELILGVNIALGSAPLSACPAFDPSGDEQVGISELVTAVNNALNGCGGTPRPTRTPTATPIASATPSHSPTPTVVIETARTFTIHPLREEDLIKLPSQLRTGLFNTPLSSGNAALSVSPGPLILMLGTPDTNGVATLRLAENVIVEMGVIDGRRICIKMLAAGSEGSIDCDGGTAYDVEGSQPAGNTGSTLFAVRTGLGNPSGSGHGNLLVDQLTQPVPLQDQTPCSQVKYTLPVQRFAYTTANAVAIKGTQLKLEVPGEPFNCATFATPGSGGMLAGPAPTWDEASGLDVAAVFRFAE